MNFIEKVAQAGVVGAGGAGFPTHVKLKAKADYFIINAAECEPLIETDKYLMRSFPSEIISATVAIGNQLAASHMVIAIKAKYKAEITALSEAIAKQNAPVTLFLMESFYPAGDEQIIVAMVTGNSVPERGLPLDVSAVVDNVGTVLSVYDALKETPVSEKYLSITGAVKEPLMLKVPLGTKITDCIAAATLTTTDYHIILGGPMMGKVILDSIENLSVSKTTGNILILPKNHYLFRRAAMPFSRIRAQTKGACIQCKFCTELCPRYLTGHTIRPHLVMRNLYRENEIQSDEEFARAFGDAVNCCDCGVCELFACPMGLSPRKVNGYMKAQLKKRSITIPRKMDPRAREGFSYKKIPTDRLVARLGLREYAQAHAQTCISLSPSTVIVSLSQHIGAPAVPCVSVGQRVAPGDLIGTAAENALSANIHTGLGGTVREIKNGTIIIEG